MRALICIDSKWSLALTINDYRHLHVSQVAHLPMICQDAHPRLGGRGQVYHFGYR